MRLIDANKLIKHRVGCKKNCNNCEWALDRDSHCDGELYVVNVLQAPTIEAEPVRHAHWEFPVFADRLDAYDPRCVCSECGSVETPLTRHKYCPNCGARMDELEDNE